MSRGEGEERRGEREQVFPQAIETIPFAIGRYYNRNKEYQTLTTTQKEKEKEKKKKKKKKQLTSIFHQIQRSMN